MPKTDLYTSEIPVIPPKHIKKKKTPKPIPVILCCCPATIVKEKIGTVVLFVCFHRFRGKTGDPNPCHCSMIRIN